MTTEKRLQDYILTRYRSIREFTQSIDMPYSTFATILSRGIDNSSVTTIIKICKGLGISADDLANGRITPTISSGANARSDTIDLLARFSNFESEIKNAQTVTVRGSTIEPDDLGEILNALEIGLEIGIRRTEVKRKSVNEKLKTANKNHNKMG